MLLTNWMPEHDLRAATTPIATQDPRFNASGQRPRQRARFQKRQIGHVGRMLIRRDRITMFVVKVGVSHAGTRQCD